MADRSFVFTLLGRDRVSRVLTRVGTNAQRLHRRLLESSNGGRLAMAGLAAAATPAAAAVVAGTAAMGAAFASGGAAAGAFKLAVQPQLAAVTNASDLYTKAQEAQAEGGEKAKAAQQAYEKALAKMPKATQGTAKAFIGLKGDFTKWSDSLSGTTMPIFTKGINVLRAALPALTPLVRAGANALGGFVDRIAKSVKGGGFKRFIESMASSAQRNLTSFLNIIRNIGVGFHGLLRAFLPASTGMSGGLERLTAKFAAFGQALPGSQGLARFQEFAGSGGGALARLGTALVALLASLAPVLGATAILAETFAKVVAATPVPVLVTLGQILLVTKTVMLGYAVATRVVAIATRAWAAATRLLSYAMRMNPIGLIITGIVALVAIVVIAYKRFGWFRAGVQAAWRGIQIAFTGAVGGVRTAIRGITGALGAVITFFRLLPGRIVRGLGSLGRLLWGAGKTLVRGLIYGSYAALVWFAGWSVRIRTAVTRALRTAGSWLASKGRDLISGMISGTWRGLRGIGRWGANVARTVGRAIRNAGRLLFGKGRDIIAGLISGAWNRMRSIGGWGRNITLTVGRAIRGAGRLLYSKGRDIIAGFLSGTWNKMRGIWGWGKNIRSLVNKGAGKFGSLLRDSGSGLIKGLISGTWSAMKGIWGWGKKIKDKVIKAIKSAFGIKSPARSMLPLGYQLMAGLMKGLLSGQRLLKGAVKGVFKGTLGAAEFLIGKGIDVTGFIGKGAKGLWDKLFGGSGKISGGGGAARWAPTVLLALKMLGQPASLLHTVLRRMNQESGGNPRAINNWDINAKNGDPSRGLMQTIGGTFNAYAGKLRGRGIYDPLANIYASMRYALARYGSLARAYNRPGGYARGGKARPGEVAWVGEEGAELMHVTEDGVRIYPHGQSMRMARGRRLPGFAKGGTIRWGRNTVNVRGIGGVLNRGFLEGLTGSMSAIRSVVTRTTSAITKAFAKVRTRFDNQLVARVMRQGNALQKLASQRDSLASRISAAQTMAGELASSAREGAKLSSLGLESGVTGWTIRHGLAGKLNRMRRFAGVIKTLAKMGLSPNLLRQVLEMGPEEGYAYAVALQQSGRGGIASTNKLQSQIDTSAATLGRIGADRLYDSGKNASKGFLAGLQSQRKHIVALMWGIARSMSAALRNALRSRSPSQVTHAIGVDTMAGLTGGMASRLSAVTAVAGQAARTAADGMRPVVARPAAARGGGQGQTVNIHVDVSGATDPIATAREIRKMLLELKRASGGKALGIA